MSAATVDQVAGALDIRRAFFSDEAVSEPDYRKYSALRKEQSLLRSAQANASKVFARLVIARVREGKLRPDEVRQLAQVVMDGVVNHLAKAALAEQDEKRLLVLGEMLAEAILEGDAVPTTAESEQNRDTEPSV